MHETGENNTSGLKDGVLRLTSEQGDGRTIEITYVETLGFDKIRIRNIGVEDDSSKLTVLLNIVELQELQTYLVGNVKLGLSDSERITGWDNDNYTTNICVITNSKGDFSLVHYVTDKTDSSVSILSTIVLVADKVEEVSNNIQKVLNAYQETL